MVKCRLLLAFLLLVPLLLACPPAALARVPEVPQAGLAVRLEALRHGQADRVVVWLRPSVGLDVHQENGALFLALPAGAVTVPPAKQAAGFGGWVTGLTTTGGQLRIGLAPGGHSRVRFLSNRIWIDVDSTMPKLVAGQFIPAQVPARPPTALAAKTSVPTSSQPTAPPATAPKQAASPSSPPAEPSRAASEWPSPSPAPSPAPGPVSSPVPVSPPAPPGTPVTLLADTAPYGGASILLPVARAAMAAFTRGADLHIVLDSAVPLDLSALKDDPAFGTAHEHLLPDGAELILRPPVGTQPRLSRQDNSWVLTLTDGPRAGARDPQRGTASITGRMAKGKLLFLASSPGHVVVVEDEVTGGRLLVGTQHEPGQLVPAGHESPEFSLLPSWQGIVVLPQSDRLVLRDRDAGFELAAAGPPALAAAWPDGLAGLRADGAAMTRRFNLPNLPAKVLLRRLVDALREAAVAPHTGRTAPRLRVAQAMLAAGLDREAGAALQVAQADDPAASADPTLQGLASIAAWLSARAGGSMPSAPGLDPAQLGTTDEAMLWRALWLAGKDRAGAAVRLASCWPLLLNYPQALRRPMLPAVAEILGGGGQEAALSQFLEAFPGPELDLARASQLARQGKSQDSLKILDRLAAGRDRLVRAQAQEVAVEQRLESHALTAAAAAAAMDRSLYAWRGGDRELRVRLRAAQLHAQAGEWRQALALLRETDPLFPAAHDSLHATQVAVVATILHSGQASLLNALDLVGLADEASHLLSPADVDTTLAPLLAERLAGLDLPARAGPILRRLMDRAPEGGPRAAIGLRLAGLLAEDENPAAALSVLQESAAGSLDAGLTELRTVLRARILADSGHAEAALAQLAGISTPAALDLQATIQERHTDWQGAERSLQTLVDSTGFSALPAQARREAVLRAVRDGTQASDMPGLHAWRARFAPLFSGQKDANLFNILTAEPVQRLSDLPRAGRELGLIRGLPAALAVASARP